MKRILMICVALLGMVLASCHQDEDDLFTTAAITLTAEEGTTVERVQGTVQLTNLNTRQVTTTAEFFRASCTSSSEISSNTIWRANSGRRSFINSCLRVFLICRLAPDDTK